MTAAEHDHPTSSGSSFGRFSWAPDWLDVSEWSLRRKMAVALAIPVLLAMSFGGVRVSDQLAAVADFSTAQAQVDLLQPAVDLVASSAELTTASPRSEAAAEADANYERAVEELRQASDADGVTGQQKRLVDDAITATAPLENLSGEEAMDQLRTVSSPVIALINDVADTNNNIRLLALGDVVLGVVALANEVTYADDDARFSRAAGQETVVVEQLAGRRADGDAPVAALRQHVALRIDDVNAETPAEDLRYVAESRLLYDGLANEVSGEVTTSLERGALAARSSALRDAALVLAALLAALTATLLIARMMINPIQRVRRDVLRVAHRALPKAVEAIREGHEPAPPAPMSVHSREEIGQLARAVDTMQGQALNLASDQARLRAQVSSMFETMSRRSKALVDQQLELIDSLERDEEDPQRLQSLFRLDHLAAQMRRNGESLLIVAGGSARASVGRSLTLSETVQAAMSGVAGYERVEIGHFPDISVSPKAAGDVVHVLGELVDNALSYSPPTTTVRVNAARGIDGGTVLEIVDRGLGMSRQDLDQMNQRLSASDELTADTARRMGLFVAATLARRHGLEIRLRANPDEGTTASVYLPLGILHDGTAPVETSPDDWRRAREPDRQESPAETVDDGDRSWSVDDDASWARQDTGASWADPETDAGWLRQEEAPSSARWDLDEFPAITSVRRDPSDGDGHAPSNGQHPDGRRAVQIGSSMNQPPPSDDDAPDSLPRQDDKLTVPQVSSEYLDEFASESTPIFDSVRSQWLDESEGDSQWSPTNADAGWTAAEQAVTPEPSEVTSSGLPRRRPGAQLVPGGSHVATDHQADRRPDDVRRRLANLNSGVRRGREEGASGSASTRNEEI